MISHVDVRTCEV